MVTSNGVTGSFTLTEYEYAPGDVTGSVSIPVNLQPQ